MSMGNDLAEKSKTKNKKTKLFDMTCFTFPKLTETSNVQQVLLFGLGTVNIKLELQIFHGSLLSWNLL